LIPDLLPIFLHGYEIKSVRGLGTRLKYHTQERKGLVARLVPLTGEMQSANILYHSLFFSGLAGRHYVYSSLSFVLMLLHQNLNILEVVILPKSWRGACEQLVSHRGEPVNRATLVSHRGEPVNRATLVPHTSQH